MTRRTPLALVLLAALAGGGCGTVGNLKHPTFPPPANPEAKVCCIYGGVRNDWTGITAYQWENTPALVDYVALPILMGFNLFLDAVGDTVTLPYTVGTEVRRQFPNSEQPPAPAEVVTPKK